MFTYIGLDDTDVQGAPMGTGRLARMLAEMLPKKYKMWGVLRHQLPRLEGIPYTSNNSSACIVLETKNDPDVDDLLNHGAAHLDTYASEGSDPGLCILKDSEITQELVQFSVMATGRRFAQKDAMGVVPKDRLLGLGGTNDGIIGAAAAVGLSKYGWCGRFIEYGALRKLSDPLKINDLYRIGLRALSVDRDPSVPLPEDTLETGGWIRPSLMAGVPVLQVVSTGPGAWKTAHTKRKK